MVVPHVVLTGLSFGPLKPEGTWLLEQIRRRSDFAQTRVIAVTGHVLDAAWRREYDFDAVVMKPFDPDQLVTVVAQLARALRRS